MDQIWHVSSKTRTKLNLWKEEKNHFRIIEFGKFTALLTGSDYTLIHKSMISAFDLLLSDQLEIRPVRIYRKAT